MSSEDLPMILDIPFGTSIMSELQSSTTDAPQLASLTFSMPLLFDNHIEDVLGFPLVTMNQELALAQLGLPPEWLQTLKPKGPNSLDAFHRALKQRHGVPQWRQSAEYAQLETLLKNELDDVLAATWGQVTRENLDMELADLKAIFKHLHLAGRPAKVPGIVMVFRRRLMNNSYTRGTG